MGARHFGVVVVAVVILGAALGCGAADKGPSKKEASAPARAEHGDLDKMPPDEENLQVAKHQPQADPPAGAAKKLPADRKIIYTATLKLQVEDFDKAQDALLELVEKNEGVLEQSDTSKTPGASRSGYWKIRVAPDRLAAFRKAVAKLGETEQNKQDSKDVSEEYVDLTARIKNKQAQVEQYRELFKKAATTTDILSVDKELYKAQEDLERMLGRKKFLEDLSDLATVHVHLRERTAYVAEESADFGTSVSRTFSASLNALVQFGRGVALVAVAATPWLPVVLVVGLPFYVWYRRSRRIPEIPVATEVPPPTRAG